MTSAEWADSLPEHCPIQVTADGFGPAFGSEAFKTVCWCGDSHCTRFYGIEER